MRFITKNINTSIFKWIIVFSLLFYTSTMYNRVHAQNFTQSQLDFNGFGTPPQVTSLMYGPDGRLYALDYPGTVYALTIQRNAADDYIVTAKETILAVQNIVNHDDDGNSCSGTVAECNKRESTGLTVAGTAANPIIYVTSSDFRIGSGLNGGQGDVDLDTNSGVITRLSWNGTTWDVVDLVRGLPRSEENHATNGLEFVTVNGNDYLIVNQGGHANGGSPSINFSLICEYALSGALLSVDLTMLEGMTILNDGSRNYIYDIPTLDDPTRANVNGITDPNDSSYDGKDINDPFGGNDGLNQAMIVTGGPVQIFSPGYRNPYDLVVTESGAVYTTDNGANGNWGGFPVNEGGGTVTNAYDTNETGSKLSTATADGEYVNNVDHLQLITTNIQTYSFGSFYGGHPNPIRANPTGAGLYTAPALIGTTGAVFRTQNYDPDGSTSGSTTNVSNALPANWPPVQSANAVEGDWRGPGITNPDGPDDNAVVTWATNTNGLDEYTASNFGGAMKGDLLAGSNLGSIRRVELATNGMLEQYTEHFLTGIIGDALGITCNSDNDAFPGTIWVGSLSKKIMVFEPIEPVSTIFPFRINAGGPETTYNSDVFIADQNYISGTTYSNASAVVPTLYQTERTNTQPNFEYEIPVPNGNYIMTLHFAEIYWGATGGGVLGTGQRIFDVSIEGSLVLDNYDIIADVGSETAVTKSFNVTVSDGNLNLNVSSLTSSGGVNQPKISAIEVLIDGNASPVAVSSATPLSGDAPLQVNFTGDNSTDDVAVVSYEWDFKDGSSVVTTANPVHTFTTAGTYIVELKVQDIAGFEDTTTVTVVVTNAGNSAPVAVASASPLNGNTPLEVTFSGDDSTDDVGVISYLWDFKDGTSTVTDENPVHTFTNTGTYLVELTVEDNEGLSDTEVITITVGDGENESPVAIISASVETGVEPLEVSFTAENSTDDVGVVSYLWSFGDGSSNSTEMAPDHVFSKKGVYVVTLIVTDADDLTNEQSITISVTNVGKQDVTGILIVNPSKDVAQVRIIDNSENSVNVVEVYLFDSIGRLIDTYAPQDIVAHGLYEIPIATLSSSSIYYIRFKMSSGDPIIIDLVVQN